MKELTEKELKNVAGGQSRERTMVIQIVITGLVSGNEVVIEPYVDGILMSNQVKKIDPQIIGIVYISVKGREGKKRLDVKIGDSLTKTYEINFDSGEYVEF